MIVIVFFFACFKQQIMQLGWLSGALFFYGLITITVVGVSYLSKRFFENPFLRLKDRFL
jgi:peptidoglycan/LPS O-acetylase OafA/YrhL